MASTKRPEEQRVEVEEEVWALPDDFDLYATHEVRTVRYPRKPRPQHNINDTLGELKAGADDQDRYECNGNTATAHSFSIECIEPSSPLDINNSSLSSKQYDATGHCVWAGAFLLLQCIHRLLEKYDMGNKRIIELGCGTGVGGLALLCAEVAEVVPSHVCFTDNDPEALKVCERNCRFNNLPEASFSIRELTWGDEETNADADGKEMFDVALATDVLYDVDLIEPLFTTVAQCLPPRGIFVLSHIPRACYNEGNPPEAIDDLEGYIINQAGRYGLETVEVFRPPKEGEVTEEILEWCPASAFVGGGVIVFRRS